MKKSLKKILGLMAICACSVSVGVGLMQKETAKADADVDAVTVENLETFAMYGGASTRLNEPYGLRFTTEISASEYAGLVKEYGEEELSFGTLIAPLDLLENGIASLTVENAQVKDEIANLPRKHWSSEDGVNVKYFNAAITDIKETNLSRKFAAISYLTVGDTTVYADTDRYNKEVYHRSILDVADAETKDPEWLANADEDEITFVENTLSKGVDFSDRILFVTANKTDPQSTAQRKNEGMEYSTGLSEDVTLTRNGVSETKTAIASVQVSEYSGILNGNAVNVAFRFAPDFSKTNLQRMKEMGYATFRVTYGVDGEQSGGFEPTLVAGGTYTAKDDSSTYRYTNKWYTLDFDIDVLLEAEDLLAANSETYVLNPLIKMHSVQSNGAYTVYFAEIGFVKEVKGMTATATIIDSAEKSLELTEQSQYVGMPGVYTVQVDLSQSEYAHLYNATLVKDGEEVIDLKGLNGDFDLKIGKYVLKAEPMLPMDVDASFTYAFSVEGELTSVSAINDVNDILTLHQTNNLNGLFYANGIVFPDNVTASEVNTTVADKNSVAKQALYQYNVDIEKRGEQNYNKLSNRPVIGIDFKYTADELITYKERGLTTFRFTFMMQTSDDAGRQARILRVLKSIDDISNDYSLSNATYETKEASMNEWITVEFNIETIINWLDYIDATKLDANAFNADNNSYNVAFSEAIKGIHSLIQMDAAVTGNAGKLLSNYTVYVAECAFVKE